MEENRSIFGSNFFVSETQNFLTAEMTIIRGIIEENKLKGRALNLLAMIFGLLSTGSAIFLLSKDNQRFYNECVMLARSFFERITNICFLLVCKDETFEECMDHTLFRQYLRGVKNNKVVKNNQNKVLMQIKLKNHGIKDLKEDPKMKPIIEKFKKSKRTRFPLPKIEKKLGLLSEYSKYLNVSLFLAYQHAYYDDASEALQGSYYGSLFHVLNIKDKDRKSIEIETNKNTSLLLLETGELIHQLISLLRKDCSLNIFYKKSSDNSRVMAKKLKCAIKK